MAEDSEQSPQHEKPPVSRFGPKARPYLDVTKLVLEAPVPLEIPTSDEVLSLKETILKTLEETLADQVEAVREYFRRAPRKVRHEAGEDLA